MKRIYVDYNATVPVTPSHCDMVCDILKTIVGNPSSIHYFGREAKVALEDARENVAKFFACDSQEIIFNSGATEGNNLIIQGVVGKASISGRKPHIIITAAEHSSVRNCAKLLNERGVCDLSIINVFNNGLVDREALLSAINDDTCLVSVIHANNEVGVVNPIEELAAAVKDKNNKIHFHADGVQAFGKLDLTSIANSMVDSVSVSGHKVGAYKGCGAVYLKRGTQLNSLIIGGGQERARRAGTENMPGIISFGLRAKEILQKPDWLEHCTPLFHKLNAELGRLERVVVHTNADVALGTTLNFHVEGVSGEELLLNLDLAGICVSTGSACSSGVARPSEVLLAMGYSQWAALNSIRISFGHGSCASDVDAIIGVLKQVISRSTSRPNVGNG
ncbi:MAG: cysteine desulfurase family protein [Bdellovibrionota bacterium]